MKENNRDIWKSMRKWRAVADQFFGEGFGLSIGQLVERARRETPEVSEEKIRVYAENKLLPIYEIDGTKITYFFMLYLHLVL